MIYIYVSKQLDPLSSHPWNAMDSSVNKTTIFIHVHWYLQWIPSHECQEQLKTLECQLLDSTEKAWAGSAGFESRNFDIDMCPIHAKTIWCLKGWWLCTSSPPHPHNFPHCRRKSDLYWKTWRLRHLHAQKRRSKAWSGLGNWLQRCYSDLFTF